MEDGCRRQKRAEGGWQRWDSVDTKPLRLLIPGCDENRTHQLRLMLWGGIGTTEVPLPHPLCSPTTKAQHGVSHGFICAGLVAEHSFSQTFPALCDTPGEHLRNVALGLVQDGTSEQEKVGPGKTDGSETEVLVVSDESSMKTSWLGAPPAKLIGDSGHASLSPSSLAAMPGPEWVLDGETTESGC